MIGEGDLVYSKGSIHILLDYYPRPGLAVRALNKQLQLTGERPEVWNKWVRKGSCGSQLEVSWAGEQISTREERFQEAER